MNFQKSNIRSNQNKIFKNRVFVEILQFSKKYEFNKAKSVDHSIVFKISIFRFFIDENFFFCERIFFYILINFSLNFFDFLNLFLSNFFKKYIYS